MSVIQDPKRDPEARIVMGLLTPVSFPQPGQREKRDQLQQRRQAAHGKDASLKAVMEAGPHGAPTARQRLQPLPSTLKG